MLEADEQTDEHTVSLEDFLFMEAKAQDRSLPASQRWRYKAVAAQLLRHPDDNRANISVEEFESILAKAEAESRERWANMPRWQEKRPNKIGTAKYRRKMRKK